MFGCFDRYVVIVARLNELTRSMRKVKQSSVNKRNVYCELLKHPQRHSSYISINCLTFQNPGLVPTPFVRLRHVHWTMRKPLRNPAYTTIWISNVYKEVRWTFFDKQVKTPDLGPTNTSTSTKQKFLRLRKIFDFSYGSCQEIYHLRWWHTHQKMRLT